VQESHGKARVIRIHFLSRLSRHFRVTQFPTEFSTSYLVLIAKLDLYVTQKLVNVAKFQKFLISYDKDELEFIVQLVLERKSLVSERLEAAALLQYHTLDQGID